MVNKAFLIAETIYLGNSFLFLFDNTISHSIYINNMFYIKGINKESYKKQV